MINLHERGYGRAKGLDGLCLLRGGTSLVPGPDRELHVRHGQALMGEDLAPVFLCQVELIVPVGLLEAPGSSGSQLEKLDEEPVRKEQEGDFSCLAAFQVEASVIPHAFHGRGDHLKSLLL